MGDPAWATARHIDELVEVHLPGLPTPPPAPQDAPPDDSPADDDPEP
jgi:hypothetical protein